MGEVAEVGTFFLNLVTRPAIQRKAFLHSSATPLRRSGNSFCNSALPLLARVLPLLILIISYLYLFYLNTANVILLFVLTKYFSTFFRIILFFFFIITKPHHPTADHLATVQASTATDHHTLDRFRASDGAHPRPVGGGLKSVKRTDPSHLLSVFL